MDGNAILTVSLQLQDFKSSVGTALLPLVFPFCEFVCRSLSI